MTAFTWRKIPNSAEVSALATLKNGTIVGVGLDNQLYSRSNLATWVSVPGSGVATAITTLLDGTLLAVGTDLQLYQRDTLFGRWTLIPQSGSVTAVAQMPDGTILGIGTDKCLYQRRQLTDAWVLIPNSGGVIAICALDATTVLGVGTDNQLYTWSLSQGGPWVNVPESGAVIAVTKLMNGMILGIGTDSHLYTRASLYSSKWNLVPDSGWMLGIAQMPDGQLVGVGTDKTLYLMSELCASWAPVANSGLVVSVTEANDGSLVGVGKDHQLYSRPALQGAWTPISNSGGVLSVSTMADGQLLGVGTDHQLRTWQMPNGPWVPIAGSGQVIAAQQLRNGIIIGVGTDNQLYTRTELTAPWVYVPKSGKVLSIAQLADGSLIGAGLDNYVYLARYSHLLSRIEHVVVFMLENRSFDSVLGYLYDPASPPRRILPPRVGSQFDGLAFTETARLANTAVVNGVEIKVAPTVAVDGTNSPATDPWEEYEHVNVQLFGAADNPKPGTPATMKGFLADFASKWYRVNESEVRQIEQIMHAYGSPDLPVLSTLASSYALSDAWYSSVPTQTNANRAFSICGTSMGLVDNGFRTTNPVHQWLADDRFPTETLWNVLERNGQHDWTIFWQVAYPPLISQMPYTRRIFPMIDEYVANADSHFAPIDRFFSLAEAGKLPTYSYIEPQWGGAVLGVVANGNDYHPPADTTVGEHFLRRLFDSMTANAEAWSKTLFVITCDEHGGTYDHVAPPWGAAPPWGGGRPAYPLEKNFQFDRFGVRIPTLVISPLIGTRTVFRSPTSVPFDHTSTIATVLDFFQVDKRVWNLGARTAAAPTFDYLPTLQQPRTDNPFAPAIPPMKSPLAYGQPFYLKHQQSGKYLARAYGGTAYWFPQLLDGKAVALTLRLGSGQVVSGDTVQIFTTEYLENSQIIASGAPSTALGAWRDQHDCYYYPASDADFYAQQQWLIESDDGGPIRYGDVVQLSNVEFKQRLSADDKFISTNAKYESWVIMPSPT
jgi:phospholipase C